MDKKFIEIEEIINKILKADSLGIDSTALIKECQELLIEYNNGDEKFRNNIDTIDIRDCNTATKLKKVNSAILQHFNSK